MRQGAGRRKSLAAGDNHVFGRILRIHWGSFRVENMVKIDCPQTKAKHLCGEECTHKLVNITERRIQDTALLAIDTALLAITDTHTERS